MQTCRDIQIKQLTKVASSCSSLLKCHVVFERVIRYRSSCSSLLKCHVVFERVIRYRNFYKRSWNKLLVRIRSKPKSNQACWKNKKLLLKWTTKLLVRFRSKEWTTRRKNSLYNLNQTSRKGWFGLRSWTTEMADFVFWPPNLRKRTFSKFDKTSELRFWFIRASWLEYIHSTSRKKDIYWFS